MSFIQQFQNISGNTPLSRRQALIGLSLLTLTACSRSGQSTTGTDNNVAYYTCTMHPFVRSQDPKGKCPVCGMSLVPVHKSSTESSSTNTATAVDHNGLVTIAPEKMQEIGATTEVVAMRPFPSTGGTPMGNRLTISSKAVLPTGSEYIVFVDHGGGKLEPRSIKIGAQTRDYYEVVSGLKAGDRVVSGANFLVDSESRIQGVLKTWGDRP